MPQLFDDSSPSIPSSSPPSSTANLNSNTHPNHNHNHNHHTNNNSLPSITEEKAITINVADKPLTLTLPSLNSINSSSNKSDDHVPTPPSDPPPLPPPPQININNTEQSIPTPPSDPLPPPPPQIPPTSTIKPGKGYTFKCKQCFARVHLDCLERHNKNTDDNNNHNVSPSVSLECMDEEDILCPICMGNASIITQRNYNNLEESLEEEKNLLRDWQQNECLACGDVGELICCDLCYYEHETVNVDINTHQNRTSSRLQKKKLHEMTRKLTDDTKGLFITGSVPKLDGAAQFHAKCVIGLNTEFIDNIIVPDPWICPLCTTQYGSNRLQSLHFYHRKRTKSRERRMQMKAFEAQQFVKQIGFEVDEIKKCIFCRIESDDTAEGVFFDKENEFIGPFIDEQNRKLKYWAHHQCVMWAPQVFMNEFNEFCSVEKEIKRGKHLLCTVCGKQGAVLGCYERGCYNTYHYPCAKKAKCYFDNELFAIYCPSHYFVHFLAKQVIAENIENEKIKSREVVGLNGAIYEKTRFDPPIVRKRKIAKSCKATDVCLRYRSTVDVWNFMMKQQHKHSASSTKENSKELSIDSVNNNQMVQNSMYLTRARKKQIELYQLKRIEKKKKQYKKSLMSFGGRKRRTRNYLDGNLICFNKDEVQLSPHERKRRKVFNLQPMTINDATLNINNDNIRIESDKIDLSDIIDAEYDMSSMVGGLDDAINVLKETVLLPLLYPELFKSFHLKPAKGVILYGPPGTGKTLLVRSLIKYYYAMSKAVFSSTTSSSTTSPIRGKSISISSPSPEKLKNPNMRYNSLADAVLIDHENEEQKELHKNESLISFFSRRGPDLLSKFHGETERNLRSLFKRAQECSPSIIFFDEIDGLCPHRSHKHEQVHNSVVATLLSLMDGLHSNKTEEEQSSQVFVIAATNRIDNLDEALRRPGRFDREIYIGLPNAKQRYKILKIHTKKWDIDEDDLYDDGFDKYLRYISINKCIGYSGADLNALCNESFMNCIHRCCPELRGATEYNQNLADKLKTNVVIKIVDFEKTFNDGFKSSNVRNKNVGEINDKKFDQNEIDNLDDKTKQILEQLIDRMDVYINRCKNGYDSSSVPLKKINDVDMEVDDDDNGDDDKCKYIRSLKQSRLLSKYNDRILLYGKNGNKNKLILSYLLHKLDIANVQHITIPMIASIASTQIKQDLYHDILSKIKLAITTGIGVIILYDLDIWLKNYPQLIKVILLSNINEMCRDRNTLIICTSNEMWTASNCWKHEWPQTIYQYFSSFQHKFHIE